MQKSNRQRGPLVSLSGGVVPRPIAIIDKPDPELKAVDITTGHPEDYEPEGIKTARERGIITTCMVTGNFRQDENGKWIHEARAQCSGCDYVQFSYNMTSLMREMPDDCLEGYGPNDCSMAKGSRSQRAREKYVG